jgi:hypothetical protein
MPPLCRPAVPSNAPGAPLDRLHQRWPCPTATLSPPRVMPLSALNAVARAGGHRGRVVTRPHALAKELAQCSDFTRLVGCLATVWARASPAAMEVVHAMGAEAATENRAPCALHPLHKSSPCLGANRMTDPRRGGRRGIPTLASWARLRPVASLREARVGRLRPWPQHQVGRRRWSSPASSQPHEMLAGSMGPTVACRRGCLWRRPWWPACEAPMGTEFNLLSMWQCID